MRTLTITEPGQLSMMMNRARDIAAETIQGGAIEVIVQEISKSRLQEAKYHSMIGDIAKSVELDGRYFGADIWKALLIDEFEQELKANGETLRRPSHVVISLDKQRAITIRPSSKDFRKGEACSFIEFLYKFGSEHDAVFCEKSLMYYQEICDAKG